MPFQRDRLVHKWPLTDRFQVHKAISKARIPTTNSKAGVVQNFDNIDNGVLVWNRRMTDGQFTEKRKTRRRFKIFNVQRSNSVSAAAFYF